MEIGSSPLLGALKDPCKNACRKNRDIFSDNQTVLMAGASADQPPITLDGPESQHTETGIPPRDPRPAPTSITVSGTFCPGPWSMRQETPRRLKAAESMLRPVSAEAARDTAGKSYRLTRGQNSQATSSRRDAGSPRQGPA